ncbi:hypothetical protein [Streptomyces sp. NPDC050504]|uniref:hypothetical protein n=1 Tax=Streptomyces sp. NPDC050504 TaxID=3365618 RepID=UPI00378F4A44
MSIRPRPSALRPRSLVLLLAALGAAGAVGAAVLLPDEEEDSRPVTLAEAQQLASARFGLYDSGTVRVALTLPGSGGTTTVNGMVDYRAHRAVGRYATQGPVASTGLIAWDATGLAVALPDGPGPGKAAPGGPGPGKSGGAGAAASGDDPAQLVRAAAANESWSPRAYTTDPLDVALRLVMALGNDRPDNAQLLAQSGPRRLRQETLSGTDYTVFSGPRPRATASAPAPGAAPARTDSPLTYWVDGSGRLGRVEARLATLSDPARWDITRAPAGLKVPGGPWKGRAAAPTGR